MPRTQTIEGKIQQQIDDHLSWFEANERGGWDKARRYYNGDFCVHSAVEGIKHHTSRNMVFSVAETAVAQLVPGNPMTAASPRNKKSVKQAPAAADIVNFAWDEGAIRSEMVLSLIDAVLLGRAIFKTVWEEDEDIPVTRAEDPYSIFFDHAARRVRDISYWLQCTPVHLDVFRKRIKRKYYKGVLQSEVTPDAYPTWLMVQETGSKNEQLKKNAEWVIVWEYYDVVNGRVYHYVPKLGKVVLDEELKVNPFSMYFLNHNGKNCLGLSEVQLILPYQDDINDILSQIKLIVLLSVPRILYNSGAIDQKELEDLLASMTGSFVGVKPKGNTAQSLAELFFNAPIPEIPASLTAFLEKQESTTAFVSALAEAARGQVTGAKTATEIALIDAQGRTRLSSREGNLADALDSVAGVTFYMASRYMKKAKLVEVSGGEYKEVGIKQLRDVDVKFKFSMYSPLKGNPAVEAERFTALYPTLAVDEAFDKGILRRELLRLNGLRPDLIVEEKGGEDITEGDVRKLAIEAARKQAEVQELGVAAGQVAPGAPTLTPEQIQEAAVAQAIAPDKLPV